MHAINCCELGVIQEKTKFETKKKIIIIGPEISSIAHVAEEKEENKEEEKLARNFPRKMLVTHICNSIAPVCACVCVSYFVRTMKNETHKKKRVTPYGRHHTNSLPSS